MKKGLTYRMLQGCLLCSTLLVGISCTKQEVEYREPAGYVMINLSWEDNVTPAGSRFWFFPTDGGMVITKDGSDKGFQGTLPPGEYHVVAVNTDAQKVGFRNMDHYETAELYVDDNQSKTDLCIGQPDNLYLSTGDSSDILTVRDRDTVQMSLTAHNYIRHIHLLFTIDDPTRVTACNGQLAGISSSIYCSTGSCTGHPASVQFTASPTDDPGVFSADIKILDIVRPENDPDYLANLTLIQEDGSVIPTTVNLEATIRALIDHTGGALPEEIPLEVSLHAVDGQLQGTVKPWDSGGSGAGDL